MTADPLVTHVAEMLTRHRGYRWPIPTDTAEARGWRDRVFAEAAVAVAAMRQQDADDCVCQNAAFAGCPVPLHGEILSHIRADADALRNHLQRMTEWHGRGDKITSPEFAEAFRRDLEAARAVLSTPAPQGGEGD